MVRTCSGFGYHKRLVNIEITGGNLSSLQTLIPENGSSAVSALPKFNWHRKPDAEIYEIQLAKSPDFSGNNLVATKRQQTVLLLLLPYWISLPFIIGGLGLKIIAAPEIGHVLVHLLLKHFLVMYIIQVCNQ